jgi:hypothetical protein
MGEECWLVAKSKKMAAAPDRRVAECALWYGISREQAELMIALKVHRRAGLPSNFEAKASTLRNATMSRPPTNLAGDFASRGPPAPRQRRRGTIPIPT